MIVRKGLEGKGHPLPCPRPNLKQLIKPALPSQKTDRSEAVKSSKGKTSPSLLLGPLEMNKWTLRDRTE